MLPRRLVHYYVMERDSLYSLLGDITLKKSSKVEIIEAIEPSAPKPG
jgi:hypothetical protein